MFKKFNQMIFQKKRKLTLTFYFITTKEVEKNPICISLSDFLIGNELLYLEYDWNIKFSFHSRLLAAQENKLLIFL